MTIEGTLPTRGYFITEVTGFHLGQFVGRTAGSFRGGQSFRLKSKDGKSIPPDDVPDRAVLVEVSNSKFEWHWDEVKYKIEF